MNNSLSRTCYRFFNTCYFVGSTSSVVEDRLLKNLHLVDQDCEQCRLQTTPVSINETMNVTMEISLRKIIALVKPKNTDHIPLVRFYSARNARIASAVLAIAIPSVRLSVRHTPELCQNDGT